LYLDGIFGFSFNSSTKIRPPFDILLETLDNFSKKYAIPIISIDIPSGWAVDSKDNTDKIIPEIIVSLTAPKICTMGFDKYHFLGGRFIPPYISKRYGLNTPQYVGTEQSVLIGPLLFQE
jgi:NAD(P)H-hydrate repair Nnr-like enzyme with NAD(P)H-hydrate epimerase domain